MPREKLPVVIGKTQETLQFSSGSRGIPIPQFADSFWIWLDAICGYDTTQIFDLLLLEIAFGDSHFETGLT